MSSSIGVFKKADEMSHDVTGTDVGLHEVTMFSMMYSTE